MLEQPGKKAPREKIKRSSSRGLVSDRFRKARPLSDEEIARRQVDDRRVLRDEPVLIGYSGSRPGNGMQFELERWDTVTHGWSHECSARTEADAKMQGRQRLGTLGHRWRVKLLLRKAGRRGGGGGGGGGGGSRNRRSRDTRDQHGRVGGRRTVTGYDPSVPKLSVSKPEGFNRTDEELELAVLVDPICAAGGIAKPRGLGKMRRDALVAWNDRISVIVEEPDDSR